MSNEITGRWPGAPIAEAVQEGLESFCGLEIRPSTVLSSALQELKLRARAEEHGRWDALPLFRLAVLMQEEMRELMEVLDAYLAEPSPENGCGVLLEVADVQNYGMMIQDNILDNIYGPRGGGEKGN